MTYHIWICHITFLLGSGIRQTWWQISAPPLLTCVAFIHTLNTVYCPQCWSTEFGEGGTIYEKITQEDCGRCCWYLILSPQFSSLWYTQCFPEILRQRALLWSRRRASGKCQGVNIPKSSPQLLINGIQKKISCFLSLWSGTTLSPVLRAQFLKKNLLSNACPCTLFLPSFPPPRPALPGITLQVNYLHSNPVSESGAPGTQPKTDTFTNCDSCKEGVGCSATCHSAV